MTYQPSLESVKTHPLPDWYNDAKLGIFIHWGTYSVPAFAPRGELAADHLDFCLQPGLIGLPGIA